MTLAIAVFALLPATPALAPAPTPVPVPAQVAHVLIEQQFRVDLARERYQAESNKMEALTEKAARLIKLDSETHTTNLERAQDGTISFSVKAATPTPAPASTPSPAPAAGK